MKEEVFRMERVTFREQEVTELRHCSLTIFAGEIIGLLPVDDKGLDSLWRLMTQNLPIDFGSVYLRGKAVNRWQASDESFNRVAVIRPQSSLAGSLTVAENVFVMRHGFKQWLLRRRMLERQLAPLLRDIGLELRADLPASRLTPLQRIATELLKAVAADCRLIVLIEPGTLLGERDLQLLHRIIRHYAAKGFAFLYESPHYEDAAQIADRVAVMLGGQITKMLSPSETPSSDLTCYGIEDYADMVRTELIRRPTGTGENALSLYQVHCGGLRGLDLTVRAGECVVLQDMDSCVTDDLVRLFSGQAQPESGSLLVSGRPYRRRNARDLAVIDQLATESMIFPDLSYIDNLLLTADHRMTAVWRSRRLRRGIRKAWEPVLGQVFDRSVETLSRNRKYDLIYTRALLQKPKAVLCVQPFMHADMEHRRRIWGLMNRLLDKGIAVVILALNLADSLAFADRLVRVKDGRCVDVLERSEFGSLPGNTPWHQLWEGKADASAPSEEK